MFNNNDWLQLMEQQVDKKKTEELTSQLIAIAMKGEHKSPEFIKSFVGLRAAKEVSNGLTKLMQGFQLGATDLFDKYLDRCIKEKVDDVNLLYHHRIMLQCADFYWKENILVRDAISEYENYMANGHMISSFIGEERSWQDLYDTRTGSKDLPTLEELVLHAN